MTSPTTYDTLELEPLIGIARGTLWALARVGSPLMIGGEACADRPRARPSAGRTGQRLGPTVARVKGPP
jgi:hypothetical protein